MGISKIGLTTLAAMTLAVAGCQSERFSSMNTAPAPLTPAPVGTVTASQLPPPAPATAAPEAFPEAPGAGEMQVAAIDPAAEAAAAASAPEITANSVAGVWNASVSGQSCRIATSLTRLGNNNRAAPLRCASPVDGVRSWNVEGRQLVLYDDNAMAVARLYSSGAERFDGQTTSGAPLSLSR